MVNYFYLNLFLGKARRLKQAKEEAQAEIDSYRLDRDRQYKQHEAEVSQCTLFITVCIF